MRHLCRFLGLLVFLILPSEGSGEEYAFLEVDTVQDAYFVQEPVRVRVRFGLDAEFFKASSIPLFHRRLDLSVQVLAPWLKGIDGMVREGQLESRGGRDTRTFVLNDGPTVARRIDDRRIGDRVFEVYEISRRFWPSEPGEVIIPESTLCFAFATKFADDFLNGRRPLDRKDASVSDAGMSLTIHPLPDSGRPSEFTGAVGRFFVQADASSTVLDVGESFKLVLTFEGEGNLAFFETPELMDLSGFHRYGKIETKEASKRTVTYDLAPLSGEVGEIPAIRFGFFDPRPPAAYQVISTDPIPLTVTSLAGEFTDPPPHGEIDQSALESELFSSEEDGFDLEEDIPSVEKEAVRRDIYDLKTGGEIAAGRAERGGVSPVAFFLVILAPWPFFASFLIWRRGRSRGRMDPRRVRALTASSKFQELAGGPDPDLARAFAEFLADRLGDPAAAMISKNLAAKLIAAGVSEELADRASEQLGRLVDARYGGDAPTSGIDTIGAMVGELDASLAEREGEL